MLAILFAAVALLQLVPVWFAQYLPTGDGPSHLYGAWLVRALALRESREPIVSYYHVDWHPVPNWAAVAFMSTAMSVFAPAAAEKLFFSLIILVFLTGTWMYAAANDPDNAAYAFLTLPLAYNQILQAGFYNFSLGVGLYLITIAFWWKQRTDASWRAEACIALLLLFCYFAHPMSAMLAILSIAILWLCTLRGRMFGKHATHLLALLPTIGLLLWFLRQQPPVRSAVRSTGKALIAYITGTQLLYTFDVRQMVFGRIFFGLMVILLLATFCLENLFKLRERDAFLVLLLLMIALYVLLPEEGAGGAAINERMALLVILTPVAWLSPRLRRFIGLPIVVSFSVIAILNAGFQLRHFRHSSRMTERFLISLRQIAPNSVVLPLLFTRSMPDAYIGYHVHAIDYVAIEKHLVDLGDYQPGTDYFPIRYNAGIRRPNILEIEGHPDRINLDQYRSANYVYTWKMPAGSPMRAQLAGQFRLVAAAEGGELYRRLTK